MSTIVLPLINLSILVAILAYFLKKPLSVFVKSRHHLLSEGLREAQKMITEAEAQKKELDRKLQNLENERNELRASLQADADAAVKNAIAKADRLSKTAVEDAKMQSQQLVQDFKREMIVETGRKIVSRAEFIIRQRITEQDSSRLREELSKEITGG